MHEAINILAIINNVPSGYIKSVSQAKQKYTLTKDRIDAKVYKTLQTCEKDILILNKIALGTNTRFEII